MTRLLHALFMLLALTGATPALTQTTGVFQDAGKRVALVIGASDYRHVPALDNPTNDARIIADALEGLRFEVIRVENPSRTELLKARQAILDSLDGSDIAFFYYAGHAIQIGNVNAAAAGLARQFQLKPSIRRAKWLPNPQSCQRCSASY